MIQVQGSVQESIDKIAIDARTAVSRVCLGVDDLQLLGSKALVFRAEILPGKSSVLYAALTSIGTELNKQHLPDMDDLKAEMEYPVSIQITSFSEDTGKTLVFQRLDIYSVEDAAFWTHNAIKNTSQFFP